MRTFELLTKEEICAELGGRCRQLRLQANLAQRELAERAGASLSSIRRLEASGRATLELLVAVTQALHHVGRLQELLIAPVLRISDAERESAGRERKRAGSPRRAGRAPERGRVA